MIKDVMNNINIKPFSPMKEQRYGKIAISEDLLREGDRKALALLFSKLIIVEARMEFTTRSVEYIAYSEEFRPVENGVQIPKYLVLLHRELHEEKQEYEYSFDFEEYTL